MQVGSLFLVEISPSCSTSGTNPFVFGLSYKTVRLFFLIRNSYLRAESIPFRNGSSYKKVLYFYPSLKNFQ